MRATLIIWAFWAVCLWLIGVWFIPVVTAWVCCGWLMVATTQTRGISGGPDCSPWQRTGSNRG